MMFPLQVKVFIELQILPCSMNSLIWSLIENAALYKEVNGERMDYFLKDIAQNGIIKKYSVEEELVVLADTHCGRDPTWKIFYTS